MGPTYKGDGRKRREGRGDEKQGKGISAQSQGE